MKHMTVVAALVLFQLIPGITKAAPQTPGPEVINLKMGDKQLTFSHRKHQKAQNSECFHCHKDDKPKIDGWGKEVAHQICISCHDLNDKGPVECKECHKN